MIYKNKIYSWKNMSLWDFLHEGNIPLGWTQFFLDNQDILHRISHIINQKKCDIIYPPINRVFRAFIPIKKIKVVIMGMDPYHNGSTEYDGSAVGLCFSVLPGNKINPSLRNIYKELERDGFNPVINGDLTHLVNQGCFLLNTALSVEKGCPDSHTHIWHNFTENVVKHIAKQTKQIVWILMGSKARVISEFIPDNHLILKTSHPSPFSCTRSSNNIPAFLGSGVMYC